MDEESTSLESVHQRGKVEAGDKGTKSKLATMGPSDLGMCLLHHLADVPECSMQFLCSQIALPHSVSLLRHKCKDRIL